MQAQYQDEEKGELVFSSFLGGAMDDTCDDLAYDSNGNLFVTGRAPAIWIPEEGTSPNLGPRGNWDIFIAKINPQRHLDSLTFIGGTRNDFSSGIVLDESGSIYVTGNTTSNNFPMSPTLPAYKGYHNNPYTYVTDMIIFKLSGGGDNILFATYLGESYTYEYGYDIVHVPGSGGVIYVTGFTDAQSNDNGVLVGFNTTLGGAASLLVLKNIGNSNSQEQAHGIAVSPLDNSLWVAGQTAPIGGSGGFNPVPGGGYDVFIQHYSAAANPVLLSSTFFGGNGADCETAGSFRECGIAVDAAGNAYIAGNTESSNLAIRYPQGGGFQDYGGGGDGFTLKVHAEACVAGGGECMKLDYWRYLGGESGDSVSSIAVSAAGDAYIAGTTESSDFNTGSFPKALIPDSTRNGRDAFLVRLAPEGYISFFTYFGGANREQAGGVALYEEEGKVALAGGTSGTGTGEFPLIDPVDSTKISEWEGFVSEFTVPAWGQIGIVVTSPTDWAAVVSLQPEFQWEGIPGTDHYSISAYPVFGSQDNPIKYESYLKSRTVRQSGTDCEHPGTSTCFKWDKSTNPYLPDFESGTFLTIEGIKEPDKKIGYAFEIVAYSADGSILASSETEYFQIPSLGGTWEEYKSKGFCTPSVDPDQCTRDNPYWNAYDDLFFYWGEAYDIPPSLLKAIMIAESATDGAMRLILNSNKVFPPHMGYGYEPGWDYKDHYLRMDPNNPVPNINRCYVPYYNAVTNKAMDPLFFFLDPQGPDHAGAFINYHTNTDNCTTIIPSNYQNMPPTNRTCHITDPLYPGKNPEIPCPYPYNITVPADDLWAPISIYYFANEPKYGGQVSVT
ncbi:MAG: SBBP repeat-containing protein, partial [Anaerolineales bacterium]